MREHVLGTGMYDHRQVPRCCGSPVAVTVRRSGVDSLERRHQFQEYGPVRYCDIHLLLDCRGVWIEIGPIEKSRVSPAERQHLAVSRSERRTFNGADDGLLNGALAEFADETFAAI